MDILPSKVREYFVSIKLLFVHQVYIKTFLRLRKHFVRFEIVNILPYTVGKY